MTCETLKDLIQQYNKESEWIEHIKYIPFFMVEFSVMLWSFLLILSLMSSIKCRIYGSFGDSRKWYFVSW
jgi:hypothetical protein